MESSGNDLVGRIFNPSMLHDGLKIRPTRPLPEVPVACQRRSLFRFLAGIACALALAPAGTRAAEDDFGEVGDFALKERSGRTVTREDLLGKVWVASFVFTRCTEGCPQIAATMKDLQKDLAAYPNVLLVTFTVDPEHDDPGELARYAEHYGADPERWLFLTGAKKDIYDLMQNRFRVGSPTKKEAHTTRLVVVDNAGHVRGYFEGMRDSHSLDPEADYQTNLKKLRRLVGHLVYRSPPSLPQDFPAFNATLNAAAGFLLLFGYAAIRLRRVPLHASCMLSALAVSALFLASYLYYHLAIKHGQPTSFSDEAIGAPDGLRYLYYAVLMTHTVLAAVVAPLALATAYLGLRGRLKRHVRLARWTLPLWLYVSVTGVVVYWMLYRLYPGT
jgi:protein SCO1